MNLSFEHAHFEKFRPLKPKARSQYGKLVLVLAP
mgnify:CR=1 FL=1